MAIEWMESEQRLSRPLIPRRDAGRVGGQGTTCCGHLVVNELLSPSVKCRLLPCGESGGDDHLKVVMFPGPRGSCENS